MALNISDISEYKIISWPEFNVDRLQLEVREHLAKGWTLHGALIVTTHSTFIQVMIRTEARKIAHGY